MRVRTFKDLEAWKEGIELAILVYETTDCFPKYELFGLTSQMRRAAVSIPSNVAEGQCKSPKEFRHYISRSRGSLHELMTLTIIAQRRDYPSAEALQRITARMDHEGKLLFGLRRSVVDGRW